MVSKNKTIKRPKKKIYTKEDYNSGDGMLTSVWGPSLWHYLHTLSFNYPVKPTLSNKKHYKNLILNLKYTLPCKWCRLNLRNNLKELPLTESKLKNRDSFSRYIYDLHELINKMLGKKSNLTYEDVRERYEHFRSRCTVDIDKYMLKQKNKTHKKEKGCTTPLYGKKSKCIIKIVPQDNKTNTFQIHNKCIKKR
jgi:hypothetical protein